MKKTVCPLTGLRARGGKVPRRPARGQDRQRPWSRPQSGLDEADIVYEEQAEGGITRYMVVFQCRGAPLVGPTCSVRWDDWNILKQYKHAILAYSGGIQPWTTEAGALDLQRRRQPLPLRQRLLSLQLHDAAGEPGRPQEPPPQPPRLVEAVLQGQDAAADALPVLHENSGGPPRPASAEINFSSAADVVWKWDAANRQWLRFYGTTPDADPGGHQFHTTNVVIQITKWRFGRYNESYGISPDVESITTGTGVVYVLRGGHIEEGVWTRPGLHDITRFTFPNGKPITLQPGQTWYEVVPHRQVAHVHEVSVSGSGAPAGASFLMVGARGGQNILLFFVTVQVPPGIQTRPSNRSWRLSRTL